MRLFAALPLPDEVQDHLDLTVGAMVPDGADVDARRGPQPVRWVPRHRRHVTLAFYGEVADGALPELAAALRDVAHRATPLTLQLRGAGVFSRRTLWVGVRQVADEEADLTALMAACEDAGAAVSRVERRDRHRAHVTLARLGSRRPDASAMYARAQALAVYGGPVWTATHLHLVSSQLGAGKAGGPRYEVEERLALGEGDDDVAGPAAGTARPGD
ncbi:RNA 2',3'-cyclic phosphodiesterase [Georgenia sp. 10Sc9-8]|uniref:RNA 2',3'-cyclic phosphodiesterase n=1 Tax=Georgenia halotolerans TaxID=3028317 RepID=A0ABT5U2R1_9MICO|nr:RNA 2',3'-cyclic phosphodiesterase [Georgenia halotolerans]